MDHMNEIRLMHLIQMRALIRIQQALGVLVNQEKIDMSKISDSVAALRAEVAAEKGTEASAVALITSLLQRISDAIANAADTDQAVADVTALTTEMQGNIGPLAAAVAANPVPTTGAATPSSR